MSSFLNGKIFKLYIIYLCYAVINYSFETSTSISGTGWLFSSAYDFMVSKIGLKPLKLKKESSLTYAHAQSSQKENQLFFRIDNTCACILW